MTAHLEDPGALTVPVAGDPAAAGEHMLALELVARLCSELADGGGALQPLEEQRGDRTLDERRQRPRPARGAPGPAGGSWRCWPGSGFKARARCRPPGRCRRSSTTTGSTGRPGGSCTSTRTSGWSSGTTRPRTSGCRSSAPTWSLDRRTSCCPLPAPEFELAVLVLRMVLKHATWDAMLQMRGALAASEQRELAWLEAPHRLGHRGAGRREHLPFVWMSGRPVGVRSSPAAPATCACVPRWR